MVKFKFIKNRISTKTKAGNAAKRVTGVGWGELIQALQGDDEALKMIGEMNKEGEMFERLFPLVEKTIGQKIKNEKDWNAFIGKTIKDGSKTEVVIQQAKQSTALANLQYNNAIKEGKSTHKVAIALEQEEHKWAIQYGRADAFVSLLMAEVEGKNRALEPGRRMNLKQLSEDRRYELDLAKHYLENGDDSDTSLISYKDYAGSARGAKGIYLRVKNFFGV